MTALRNPKGATIASRRGMENIIYDFYSDLFDSHVHLPPHHLREDGHVIPEDSHASKQGFEKDSARLTTFNEHETHRGITKVQDAALPHLHRLEEATLENTMRQLEWDDMGVKVDGRQLHHLRFADDIVLITASVSQAERMLTEFDETCGCIGLQLNLQKTLNDSTCRPGTPGSVLTSSTLPHFLL
ncbi:hypothetical protein RB195_015412 [Necator americanus]|uniref:Reverse transcriptase domain-containing protein n=2 Tax=Necator americanus TaxID=51031 RepID=A0ABR1E4G5_NECAM